jgi:hypothetical protein
MLKVLLFLTLILTTVHIANANCDNPAPRAMAFTNDKGSCPSGYYSSGNSCVPSSSSSLYAFLSEGGSCPSGYYSSGNSCVASSSSSCHAFYNSGGSCPSGYYSSGNSCVAN